MDGNMRVTDETRMKT